MAKGNPVPKESKANLPETKQTTQKLPAEAELKDEKPEQTELKEETPEESTLIGETPEESKQVESMPDPSPGKSNMPSDFNEENCVTIDGQKYEIKPTKLKYFRNKAASGYGIIKAYPLQQLFMFNDLDADQLLYDFLVAVFDDSTFIRDHYDQFDADVIDRICKIFGRLNHIDEKEEAQRKNREAQAQQKR